MYNIITILLAADANVRNEFRQFARYEAKQGQHMGAFLYSNGDHIVVRKVNFIRVGWGLF